MGNFRLDPNDPRYYGFVHTDGEFERLGRVPSPSDWNNRSEQEPVKPHFSSYRQSVQYEHVMKSTGIPFDRRNPLYGDFTTAETEFKDFDPTRNYSTTDHFNGRCYAHPHFREEKQTYKMPDGQEFPGDSEMSSIIMSKEPDGLADCVKRYKKHKQQQESIWNAVRVAMHEAAQRMTEWTYNDMFTRPSI